VLVFVKNRFLKGLQRSKVASLRQILWLQSAFGTWVIHAGAHVLSEGEFCRNCFKPANLPNFGR